MLACLRAHQFNSKMMISTSISTILFYQLFLCEIIAMGHSSLNVSLTYLKGLEVAIGSISFVNF